MAAPAMTICGTGPRYQGRLGISRGYLFVRTGALNSPRAFLPAMPPNTVSGMVTSDQMTRMTTMVPNGSAAVLYRKEGNSTIIPQDSKTSRCVAVSNWWQLAGR